MSEKMPENNDTTEKQVPVELMKFPVTKEGVPAFRDTPKWSELYHNHKGLLRKTNRETRPDGEPVTEEWLDTEATRMADVQCKMIERQKIYEQRANENKASRTLSPKAREELEKVANSDHPGAPYAKKTLERFDRYKKEDASK